MITRREELTFRYNLKQGRHGWLRLTPAYSVKIVQQILGEIARPSHVLDPFSGTGTTGLVCAEQGIVCDLIEINPFLVWLAEAKTHNYTEVEIAAAQSLAQTIVAQAACDAQKDDLWVPPIHHIERWWAPERLTVLADLFHSLQQERQTANSSAFNLALIAFCRVMIDWSNVAFNHQSMSFKDQTPSLFDTLDRHLMIQAYIAYVQQILASAERPLASAVTIHQGDSRNVDSLVTQICDCVITSPPYPNRISYIRELRPYMYWLGYLNRARQAGDMDWEAIGGTWGIATSRLAQWSPNNTVISHVGFDGIVQRIAEHSVLLANYVHKYFLDMKTHLDSLGRSLAPGAKVFYVVGNSKFYDTLVPVEQIYASLMHQVGFKKIEVKPIRKRNSKKELYEFIVSAEWQHRGKR